MFKTWLMVGKFQKMFMDIRNIQNFGIVHEFGNVQIFLKREFESFIKEIMNLIKFSRIWKEERYLEFNFFPKFSRYSRKWSWNSKNVHAFKKMFG